MQLLTAEHGTAILAALCALTDQLDRHGAPIDYERRRTLASQIVLLDPDAWTVMCRAGGTPAGAGRKLADARLWLWETLTGGLPQQAPLSLRRESPEFLPSHARFALRLPGPTARGLLEHARRLLDAHGCHDEPLAWSPRSDAIRLERLPGPDPDAVDPDRVHAALAREVPVATARLLLEPRVGDRSPSCATTTASREERDSAGRSLPIVRFSVEPPTRGIPCLSGIPRLHGRHGLGKRCCRA